uniref:Telethonin n=1 Tax=Callorhinchus milii TaxID=7868 RepID=V9LB16_CALMI
MHSSSVLKSFGGGLTLNCDIKENNSAKKEFFTAHWEDLILITKPDNRIILNEDNVSCKEHYDQKQQAMFILQRSPDQKMRMGRLGGKIMEYCLPYKNVLPVPVFMPSRVQTTAKEDFRTQWSPLLEEKNMRQLGKTSNPIFKEAFLNKGEFLAIKDTTLPKRVGFIASSSLSPDVQRG